MSEQPWEEVTMDIEELELLSGVWAVIQGRGMKELDIEGASGGDEVSLEIVYRFWDGEETVELIEGGLERHLPATAQSLWAQASFKGSDDNPLQSVEVRSVQPIEPEEPEEEVTR